MLHKQNCNMKNVLSFFSIFLHHQMLTINNNTGCLTLCHCWSKYISKLLQTIFEMIYLTMAKSFLFSSFVGVYVSLCLRQDLQQLKLNYLCRRLTTKSWAWKITKQLKLKQYAKVLAEIRNHIKLGAWTQFVRQKGNFYKALTMGKLHRNIQKVLWLSSVSWQEVHCENYTS